MVDVIVSRAVLWFAVLAVINLSYLSLSQTKMTQICVLEKGKEKNPGSLGSDICCQESGQTPSHRGDRRAHRVAPAALRQAFGAQVEH